MQSVCVHDRLLHYDIQLALTHCALLNVHNMKWLLFTEWIFLVPFFKKKNKNMSADFKI